MRQAPWMLRIGWAMSLALLLAPMSDLHAAPEVEATVAGELSPAQATALVQKRYGARVVRAASSEQGGRHLYVFLLLSASGKVWTVRIDAHSGAEVP